MDFDFLILGAGAAGLMAAIGAGEADDGQAPLRIGVLEKNAQPGVKILVCGGGRCNLTNAGDRAFLIDQFGRNGRFLTPALEHMDNQGLCDWFASQGVPTHEEHDGKMYPDSNQARSVVEALVRRARELNVALMAQSAAIGVERLENSSPGGATLAVITADGRRLTTQALLIAVGGQSYIRMGTTGDGYRFAESLGHKLVPPRPAIVPLLCKEEWLKECQGVAVADVEVRIEVSGPLPRLATGKPTPSVNDLMFTHFGLSGPAVLNLSEIVAELLEKFPAISLRIDLLRSQSREALTQTLHQWQQHQGRKRVRTQVATWVAQRLAESLCEQAGISGEQTCSQLNTRQIHELVERLKGLRLTVYQTRGFKEAMVTAGGVRLDEVDPRTLASRKVEGLYLAGEVLDLTGPSGGYNLQLAFSTGRLAGFSAAGWIRSRMTPTTAAR